MEVLTQVSTIFYTSCLYRRISFLTKLPVPILCGNNNNSSRTHSVLGCHVSTTHNSIRLSFSKQKLYDKKDCIVKSDGLNTVIRHKINVIRETKRSRRGGKKKIKVTTTQIPWNSSIRGADHNSINKHNSLGVYTKKVFINTSKHLNSCTLMLGHAPTRLMKSPISAWRKILTLY